MLARAGVQGEEVTLGRAAEDDVSGRRQESGPRWGQEAMLPLDLAGLGNDRPHGAPARLRGDRLPAAAREVGARLVGRFGLEIDVSLLLGRDVIEPGRRAVARRVPVLAPRDAGPDHDSGFRGESIGDADGTALGIESRGP